MRDGTGQQGRREAVEPSVPVLFVGLSASRIAVPLLFGLEFEVVGEAQLVRARRTRVDSGDVRHHPQDAGAVGEHVMHPHDPPVGVGGENVQFAAEQRQSEVGTGGVIEEILGARVARSRRIGTRGQVDAFHRVQSGTG